TGGSSCLRGNWPSISDSSSPSPRPAAPDGSAGVTSRSPVRSKALNYLARYTTTGGIIELCAGELESRRRGSLTRRRIRRCLRARWLFAEPGREPEGTPCGGLTYDADLAAHHRHELLRDRQPKSGSPVPACDRFLSLGERAEQVRLLLRSEANAGIDYLKPQQRRVVSLR